MSGRADRGMHSGVRTPARLQHRLALWGLRVALQTSRHFRDANGMQLHPAQGAQSKLKRSRRASLAKALVPRNELRAVLRSP
eukprot:10799531-Alexandrium_andersonii.AAC.1